MIASEKLPNEIQSKVNLESKDELTNKKDRILPNSDEQQFSLNNVHTFSRDKVVRI